MCSILKGGVDMRYFNDSRYHNGDKKPKYNQFILK